MSGVSERLLKQFRDILAERLERLGRDLMALEAGPDAEVGKAMLRELHGLKGEARMMGFGLINDLTHAMEEVVRAAQDRSYVLGGNSIDALLVACDMISASAALPLGQSVPGPPDSVPGLRGVTRFGHCVADSAWITGLPANRYYFTVQAIDASFAGSAPAAWQTLISTSLLDAEATESLPARMAIRTVSPNTAFGLANVTCDLPRTCPVDR